MLASLPIIMPWVANTEWVPARNEGNFHPEVRDHPRHFDWKAIGKDCTRTVVVMSVVDRAGRL